MANSIDLITKYSTKAWDKVYKAEAISSLLDAPANQVQFTGAKTVKIAKFTAGGLGNYYRNNDSDGYDLAGNYFGYAQSTAGLVWEEFTLRQDRSARYQIEMFDNEETDGLALGAATTEISRTIMIPEVDAYCFSEVAKHARAALGNLVNASFSYASDGSGAYKYLNAALQYFEEHEVPAEKQIIFVSPKFMNDLRVDTRSVSRLLQSDMAKDVKFSISSYEGRKLVVVPPQRFKTLVTLSGRGINWESGSAAIDFMVVAADAVLHVVKYNKVKIISGDINLAGGNFDGYSIFARIYHDVFVPENKEYAIYVHTGGSSTAFAYSIILEADSTTNRITTLRFSDPALKVRFATSVESGLDVGDVADATKLTTIKVGATLTAKDAGNSVAGTVIFAIDEDGKVLAKTTEYGA